MCLILFSYADHPIYQLILAGNRDEFFNRPTAALDYWEDHPDILAGRDLKDGGTWMGITTSGRIAAITNYRDPLSLKANAPSRGNLVKNFLSRKMSPEQYLADIDPVSDRFNGFNLLIGDRTGLFYYSNMSRDIIKVSPGIHGLSNHYLDTPWPKIKRGKDLFAKSITNKDQVSFQDLFLVLKNQIRPNDAELPDTGVGITWERLLSSIFIESEIYGTRCSSIVLIEKSGQVTFMERTFNHTEQDSAKVSDRKFEFSINLNPV